MLKSGKSWNVLLIDIWAAENIFCIIRLRKDKNHSLMVITSPKCVHLYLCVCVWGGQYWLEVEDWKWVWLAEHSSGIAAVSKQKHEPCQTSTTVLWEVKLSCRKNPNTGGVYSTDWNIPVWQRHSVCVSWEQLHFAAALVYFKLLETDQNGLVFTADASYVNSPLTAASCCHVSFDRCHVCLLTCFRKIAVNLSFTQDTGESVKVIARSSRKIRRLLHRKGRFYLYHP